MVNLTVDEARIRAASIDVRRYEIALDLDSGDATFESTTRISVESLDGADTFIEVDTASLRSVELNGKPLDPALLTDARFPLPLARGPNDVTVRATMAYSHDGEGVHRSVDPEDGNIYLYAMAFLDAAPRVFGCFDQPDLKASFHLRVRVPDGWTVLGTGRAESGDVHAGWWQFPETLPLSTYLMTFVAGPYHLLTTEHDGIRLGLACRESLAPHLDKDAEELFKLTAECFDEYHRLFGIRYPFGDSYHLVFVPESNSGAMENPGCVTCDDVLIFRARATASMRSERANMVAHEMAHQWFGDLVTMRWWDDLWLNESFADYMGRRVCVDTTDFTDNWLLFALKSKAWGLEADLRSSTHPVAGNGAPDAHTALTNFDGISYAKGAVVLRQLNSYLGDEAFLAGIVEYLMTHSFANATMADLLASWEGASGEDLSAWTDAWLRTSGVDTLSVHQGATTTIERHDGSTGTISRAHAIQVTSYDADGTATTVPVMVTGPLTEIDLDTSTPGTVVLPDSADESWVRVRLDPGAIEQLSTLLPKIESATSRAVVWGALRGEVLDARLSPQTYLDIVCAALPREPEDIVLGRVLSDAVRWAGAYLPTGIQIQRLEHLTRSVLDAAAPGSNRQLVAARQMLLVCGDESLLWSWLEGHAPAGLLVDSDLRWRVVEQLCALGSAGLADIARQKEADPTSQGALAALRCGAAIPSHDSKREAWETITSDEKVSNHDLSGLTGSFFRHSQHEITRPYELRFFTDLPATARIRGGFAVELSCRNCYPRFATSDEVMAMAESVLAGDDLSTFARRAISDETDDLRRLRASRAAFASS
jgi:aminopeptidase N